MRVLFFFILSLISVSYVQSSVPACVICAYQGANGNGSFRLEDVPDRCEAVLYGGNYFNIEPPKADTDAITALKNAGKPVYMLYIYGNDENGPDLWNLALPNVTHNLDQYMAPMISYLTCNKIDGVLFGFLHINEEAPPCYDVQINEFLCKIKKLLPSIKVGLMLPGWESDQWHKNIFNFTETNAIVDFYMIDTTSAGNSCNEKTRTDGGLTPLTSNDPTVASLTNICSGTSSSGMDLCKVMINVVDSAYQIDSSDSQEAKSVSAYCLRDPKELWCIDSIELIYKQVEFFKKTFKGIMMSYLDTDDMDGCCKCGKYPLTNAFIDAWQNKPIKCCDAIV